MADKDIRIEFMTQEDGTGFLNLPPLATERTLRDLQEGNAKHQTKLEKYILAMAKSQAEKNKDDKIFSDLLDALQKETETTEENTKDMNETIKETEEAVKSFGDVNEEQSERLKQAGEQQREALNRLARTQNRLAKDFQFTMGVVNFFVKSLLSAGTIAGGYLVTSVTNTGESLKSLTDVGQAFGDVTARSNDTTINTLTSMGRLGLTVDQATTVLSTFSRTAAILGQRSFVELNSQFLELTNYGRDLGVTLDDATQLFQEDQDFRSRILTRDQLTNARTADLSAQSIRQLRMFSTALGISTDELRQNARNLVGSNSSIRSLIMNMGAAGPEVQQALENFVAGLQGAGVDDGFIEGILEVASVGAAGASDFLNMLGTIDGGLRDEFIGIAMSIRNGAMSVDEVPAMVQRVIQEFSTVDPQKFQALLASGVGGELQGVAQAYIDSAQSASQVADKLRESAEQMGMTEFEYDNVQKALVGVENIFKRFGAQASVFQLSLVGALGSSFDAFIGSQEEVNNVMNRFGGVVQHIGTELGRTIGNFINRLGGGDFQTGLNKIIDGIKNFGELLVDFVDNVLRGFEDGRGGIDIAGGILNYAQSVISMVLPPLISFGFHVLMDAIFKLITSPVAALKLAGAIAILFGIKAAISAMVAGIAGLWTTSSLTMGTAMTGWWARFSTWMSTSWAALMARLNAMTMMGGGFFGGKGRGAGRGMMAGASRFIAPLAIGAGVITAGSDIIGYSTADTQAEKDVKGAGIKGGMIGAGLLAGLGLLLAPFTAGTSLALTGTGIAALGAGGYMIGSHMGKKGELKEQEAKKQQYAIVQNEDGTTSQIPIDSTATMSQPRSQIKYAAIDAITDRAGKNEGDFIRGDQPYIDRMSDEAKILISLLGELKSHRSILKDIHSKPV